jgi:hypothetical protein
VISRASTEEVERKLKTFTGLKGPIRETNEEIFGSQNEIVQNH